MSRLLYVNSPINIHMEKVVTCFYRFELRPSVTPLYTCASLWPTVAPPKFIHGGGCLEYQSQSTTVTHFRSFLFFAQELPSVDSAGIWRYGSTLQFVYSLVVCKMGARRALGSSVHRRPTPHAERQISLVGPHSINSIQVCPCAFALHQEQERNHFGASSDRRPPHVPS